MQHSVARVCLRVQTHTATHIRTIRHCSHEHLSLYQRITFDIQAHMRTLVLSQSTKKCKEIVHMVTTYIILQFVRHTAYQWIKSKTKRIDKVTMVFDIIAPIGHTSHIQWFSFSCKKDFQRMLEVLGQSPMTCKIIACASWHNTKFNVCTLLWCQIRTHDTIDYFADSTITT